MLLEILCDIKGDTEILFEKVYWTCYLLSPLKKTSMEILQKI